MSLKRFNNLFENIVGLQEECSEVVKCCCKIFRFGKSNWNPNDPNKTSNISLLETEIGHMLTMINILIVNKTIDPKKIRIGQLEKVKKLHKFYNFEGD